MESICQYCNKQFSNKYTLNNHIKTSKTCISNRTYNQVEICEVKKFQCEFCFKNFTQKNRLNCHYVICEDYKKNKIDKEVNILKDRYEIQISQLQSQIKELQDKLANLCEKAIEKPTSIHLKNNNDHSVNNNTYNQLQALNLDPDHLYKVLDKSITYADIYGGQRTLAKVIKKEILTNEKGESLALCSDRARQMIKYKNMDNQIIKDPKAFNLISQIQPIINQIALKRKAEFEAEHFSSKESKEDEEISSSSSSEIDEIDDDELSVHEKYYQNKGYISYSEMEDEDDEDEIIEKNIKQLKRTLTSPPNKKISPERLKEKEKIIQKNMQKVIKKIEKKDEWPSEKKEYYLNLLIEGIQQYQIMHINSNVFSKVLSMILPQENNLSLKVNQGEIKE